MKTDSFKYLFEPESLNRMLIKKKVRNETLSVYKDIKEDLEGLYNYLTAPNIRMKVKHPLYIAMRFPDAFQIFMSSNIFNKSVKRIPNI